MSFLAHSFTTGIEYVRKRIPALRVLVVLVIMLCLVMGTVFQRALRHEHSFADVLTMLDVGQGDSILIQSGGVAFLTDAGLPGTTLAAREHAHETMPIALGILTHPELDHFGGFIDLINRDQLGALVWNGRIDATAKTEWRALIRAAQQHHVPLITIGEGDRLRIGTAVVTVLSPNTTYRGSAELNDTSLVTLVQTPSWSALLTGDSDARIEAYVRARYPQLRAAVLKLGHHGSRFSSSPSFVQWLKPPAALVSVGARNTYGHPASTTLSTLTALHIPLWRTDRQGTVRVSGAASGEVLIAAERSSPP